MSGSAVGSVAVAVEPVLQKACSRSAPACRSSSIKAARSCSPAARRCSQQLRSRRRGSCRCSPGWHGRGPTGLFGPPASIGDDLTSGRQRRQSAATAASVSRRCLKSRLSGSAGWSPWRHLPSPSSASSSSCCRFGCSGKILLLGPSPGRLCAPGRPRPWCPDTGADRRQCEAVSSEMMPLSRSIWMVPLVSFRHHQIGGNEM